MAWMKELETLNLVFYGNREVEMHQRKDGFYISTGECGCCPLLDLGPFATRKLAIEAMQAAYPEMLEVAPGKKIRLVFPGVWCHGNLEILHVNRGYEIRLGVKLVGGATAVADAWKQVVFAARRLVLEVEGSGLLDPV